MTSAKQQYEGRELAVGAAAVEYAPIGCLTSRDMMPLMEVRSAQLYSAGERAEIGLIKGLNGGGGLDVHAVGAVVYLCKL